MTARDRRASQPDIRPVELPAGLMSEEAERIWQELKRREKEERDRLTESREERLKLEGKLDLVREDIREDRQKSDAKIDGLRVEMTEQTTKLDKSLQELRNDFAYHRASVNERLGGVALKMGAGVGGGGAAVAGALIASWPWIETLWRWLTH
jgi:DNA anti-recombination protein RmuC